MEEPLSRSQSLLPERKQTAPVVGLVPGDEDENAGQGVYCITQMKRPAARETSAGLIIIGKYHRIHSQTVLYYKRVCQ